jgi:hypothetical protein
VLATRLLALQNLAILSDDEYGAEKEGKSTMAYDVVIKGGPDLRIKMTIVNGEVLER